MWFVYLIFTAVQVTFEGDEIRFVDESSESIQVCLNLSHSDLQREITVTVFIEEGDANGRVLQKN